MTRIERKRVEFKGVRIKILNPALRSVAIRRLHNSSHSGENDIVNGDEDKFDTISDDSHDEEAHDAGLKDLHILGIVGLLALLVEHHGVLDEFLDLLSIAWLFLLLLGHLDINTTIYFISN